MIDTIDREIDGVLYRATRLPAMRAVKLLNRLGRVLGPALARLGAAFPKGGKLSALDVGDLDVGAIGDAFGSLFSSLDDAAIETLLRDLLSGVSFEAEGKIGLLFPDSRTTAFDQHFAGRVPAIAKVALFAFETNFGGFSDALAALASRTGGGKAQPSAK